MYRTLKQQNGITLKLSGKVFTVAQGRNSISTDNAITAIQYYNIFLLNF